MTKIGYLFGLTSGMLWAMASISYSILYNKYPTLDNFTFSLFILFIIELVSLIGIALYFIKRKYAPKLTKKNYLAIFSGLLGGPIAMASYLSAISLLGAAESAVISSSYPIITNILTIIFLGKNKKTLKLMLILITLIFFINLNSYELTLNYTGLFLALIASLCWGTEIFLSSFTMNNLGSDTEETYFIRQTSSTLGYIIIILFANNNLSENIKLIIDINNKESINLQIILIIASGLSYFLYYKSIAIIGPIKAMSLNITYSIWAIILSYFLLKNIIAISTIIVAVLIIITIITIIREKN